MPDIILRSGGAGADILLYEGVADAVTPLSIYLFQGAVSASDIILRPATNDGPVPITGTLAVTDGADTAAFVGAVLSAITGAIAVTEGNDTAAFTDAVAGIGTRIRMRSIDPVHMRRRERWGPRSSRGFY